MIPLCGMLQSFKQTLFEGVCQSTILSKFVKLVFGLLFGHSYQQVRMVSKMYTFQDVHTGSHFGKKTSKVSCYIMPLLYYNVKSLPHHGWLSLLLKFMTTRLPSVYIYMYPRLYTLVARVKRSVLNGYTSSPGIL